MFNKVTIGEADCVEISLCMIVKDEEEVLARCLESVSTFIDEIVIVDTGSMDGTKEIAKKFGAQLYDFEWCDDFGKARNYAFSKATKDYIMWLDADDYIDESNSNKIVAVKESLDPSVDSISMHYSLSRDEKGHTTCSLRRNRIVKASKGFKWIGRIHEYLDVAGNIKHEDIYIYHDKHKFYTDRNLRIFRDMQTNQEAFSTRDLYYFANELFYNGLYEEAIEQYTAFLATGEGWMEDRKTATANLIQSYHATHQLEKKVDVILESFKWGRPRADICCRLAEHFMEKETYIDAIFWYKVALMSIQDKDNMGMDLKEYYTWIPAIQLCVCYSRMGDYYTAYYYNELCASFVSDTKKVLYNREFLIRMLQEQGESIPEFGNQLVDRRLRW
ncbi:MAG: glycosyltransferase family 2 protein [Cellulosilyticaceae bacterium]